MKKNTLDFKTFPAWILFALILCAPAMASVETGRAATETMLVEVLGTNFEWHIRYAGPDNLLHTDDDEAGKRFIDLPPNRKVRLLLTSGDYIYTFALPEFNVKEMAVPELIFEAIFTTGDQGFYQLLGDQMCGFSHTNLMGQVVVGDNPQQENND